MQNNERLIWIDLEMTGLNPQQDYILEIVSIITDNQLNELAVGPSIVIHQPESVLKNLDPWVQEQHTKTGLLDQVRASTVTLSEAEEATCAFVQQWCEPGVCPLAGNSIWVDRAFLRVHMPTLERFFFYRMIDVSSLKEMIRRWYPDNPAAVFEKKDTHRALEDIKESIAELRYYKHNFFCL